MKTQILWKMFLSASLSVILVLSSSCSDKNLMTYQLKNNENELVYKNQTYEYRPEMDGYIGNNNFDNEIGHTVQNYGVYKINGWNVQQWLAVFEKGFDRMGDSPRVYYNKNADNSLSGFAADKINVVNLENAAILATIKDKTLINKITGIISDKKNLKHYGNYEVDLGNHNLLFLNIMSSKYPRKVKQYILAVTFNQKFYVFDNYDTEGYYNIEYKLKNYISYNANLYN